jgi:hypothetical protein
MLDSHNSFSSGFDEIFRKKGRKLLKIKKASLIHPFFLQN